MEKLTKIKLFGVEISVVKNDEQVRKNTTVPSESSTPTSSPSTILLQDDDQEKRVQGSDHVCIGNPMIMMMPLTTCTFPPVVVRASEAGCRSGGATNIRSSNDAVSRKSPTKKRLFDEIIHDPPEPSSSNINCDNGILWENDRVYYPIPLPSIPPTNLPQLLRFSPPHELGFSVANPNSCEDKKKAKSSHYETVQKRKRRNGINSISAAAELPLEPLERIPGLIQTIESQNGSRPVFLYHKKLEESDIRSHHNRLFVTDDEKLMGFLREEERTAVTKTKEGVEFVGVGRNGGYFKLRLMWWPSLKMIVINKGWTKIVSANNAQRGDFVEVWGYRVDNNELCLVLNFRKSETHGHIGDGSSSSTSTNIVGKAPSL